MIRKFKHHYQLLAIVFIVLTGIAPIAPAHETSTAFLTVASATPTGESGKHYSAVWKVQYADIVRLIDFDADGDNLLQWREVVNQRGEIIHTLKNSILFYSGQERCGATTPLLATEESVVGGMLVMQFELSCPGGGALTRIDYSFLAGIDPLHTCAYQLDSARNPVRGVFSESNSRLALQGGELPARDGFSAFVDYLHYGVVHILIGLDHLAFIFILVLSALGTATGVDKTAHRWGPVFLGLLRYITAFTVAHSFTLIASSLGYIALPAKITESIIAASVGWGAYCVIKKNASLSVWVVFAFGLLHGLGFASVLAELDGDVGSNILILLGFNIGVEVGQLLFMSTVLLAIGILERFSILPAVSRTLAYCILTVSLIWILERSLDITVIPFS